MKLDYKQIIALQHLWLDSVSLKNAVDYAKRIDYQVSDAGDLFDYLNCCFYKVAAGHFREKTDICRALNYADHILEKSEKLGIRIVSCYDDDFPRMLNSTVNELGRQDVPSLLYYRGDLGIIQTSAISIAIVGTREPSPEGITAGLYFGKKFADAGFTVISGLAKGCDTFAHEGALQSKVGKTCAILGNGLDTVYPAENENLARRIVEQGGLLMSETEVGKKADANNLIRRDRLQVGLSVVTLVLQTGVKGGTLHAVGSTLKSKKLLYGVNYKDMSAFREDLRAGNQYLMAQGAQFFSSRNFALHKGTIFNFRDRFLYQLM